MGKIGCFMLLFVYLTAGVPKNVSMDIIPYNLLFVQETETQEILNLLIQKTSMGMGYVIEILGNAMDAAKDPDSFTIDRLLPEELSDIYSEIEEKTDSFSDKQDNSTDDYNEIFDIIKQIIDKQLQN